MARLMQRPMRRQTDILTALDRVLKERRGARADSSYIASLYARGLNRILEKVGEEATEVILAARDAQEARRQGDAAAADRALVGEVADLWLHTLLVLSSQGLDSGHVLGCLEERFGVSGLAEKASRPITGSGSGT